MSAKNIIFIVSAIIMLAKASASFAWEGMAMPRLHIEGRNLKDENGNIVKLHGYAQTFSPWFNERGTRWNNYDVKGCLRYNCDIIDRIMAAGWKMNFVRMHMDPYWSNIPGRRVEGEHDISAFRFERFVKYLDEVFVPMAEYAISKGMYVVMRPPGVCPKEIAVGDEYQKYLLKVWRHVARHTTLKNHPNIMFELANEPINILGSDGTVGGGSKAHFEQLSKYFQEITDTIRAQGCNNILWIPGLGYQSKYAGYADYPIKGDNIGYAVHIYPGWFGSGHGYEAFSRGWQQDVQPVSNFAPVMITEMDWADKKWNASWGKALTGVAGDDNFGANFKKITDDAGNASWLLFTSPEHLAAFKDEPAKEGEYTFLTDPEACPWPIYHWYQEYAKNHYPRKSFTRVSSADTDANHFTNPVIFGDFPDPDVIRVGDTYYMVSTTMHIFPGATILQSKDLVNWEYACNPLESIEASDAYSLIGGKQRYSRGQWATSLQHKNGKFYMLFTTLDEGGYLLTADNIKGPWKKQRLENGFYDCGILFDGDDTYIAYGINNIHIAKVDENFKRIEDREVARYSVKQGLEGSRLYKIGDYYYIYATYGGVPAYQTIFRSKEIYGPYEEKFLLDDRNIHQGALVTTPDGEWWTMLFADKGAYGRTPYLLPVSWKEGWPAINVNKDKSEIYRKPAATAPCCQPGLPTNDNFRHYDLAPQWGWNHNSDKSKWSLTQRPGYLRLHTASITSNLYHARNTLTQRILGYHGGDGLTYGTIAIDISNMKDGDIAGLAVMQDPTAFIGVKQEGKKHYIAHSTLSLRKATSEESKGARIKAKTLYLRAVTDYRSSKARFFYSTDNKEYIPFGDEMEMRFDLSVFTGNKFAIFNYATKALGGYIDVDWFTTEPQFDEETFYDSNFEGYSEESLSLEKLEFADNTSPLLTGSTRNIELKAIFGDGHTDDVSTLATYSGYDKEIISIDNGRITALKDGSTTVTARYKGARGEEKSISREITATTFPLTATEFNPSIWEHGTFDEKSGAITTGKYGFAGWRYDSGLDLTTHKYLIVEVSGGNSSLSLRLFDENNYWSDCAIFDFGDKRRIAIATDSIRRAKDKEKRFAAQHVYILGFWTTGGVPFKIEKIYLSNTNE